MERSNRRRWAAALLFATGIATGADAETLSLAECRLPGVAEPARCGELKVPENPDQPAGRKLTIAVAVLPATGGKALADPIVPLMGGPGEDAIIAAQYFAERLASLRTERDILFVDQRGTGKSDILRCDLHDPAAPAANLRDLLPPDAVEACATELSRRADLTQYTYGHFARDLEQLRQALGYGKLNLFAGSYGTRAAQVFVRAYPDSVRTQFLGSVVPIDEVTPLTIAKASQAAFEKTFDACAAEAACRAAFPNLRDEFDKVLERLDSGSIRVSVNGATGLPLTRGRVVEWFRARLYRPATAAELPWLIHQAYAGDWSSIAAGILEQAQGFDEVYGGGLFFSITCAEDMAYLREQSVPAASANTFLGDYRVRQQQAACRNWPKASLSAGYRDPVRSPVPTMFLSGDMDAAAPLFFTQQAAKGFPNRVEIVARGQGHTEWNECVGGLYRQFVETGKAEGIDATSCPAIPRPSFKTREDQ
ncbi:MAG: alpha/beta hydrolase [Steroidobacteraceae bacterium]